MFNIGNNFCVLINRNQYNNSRSNSLIVLLLLCIFDFVYALWNQWFDPWFDPTEKFLITLHISHNNSMLKVLSLSSHPALLFVVVRFFCCSLLQFYNPESGQGGELGSLVNSSLKKLGIFSISNWPHFKARKLMFKRNVAGDVCKTLILWKCTCLVERKLIWLLGCVEAAFSEFLCTSHTCS